MGVSMARLSGRFWPIFFVINGQLLPHYTIEYRKHFTQFHATVVEVAGGLQIGATECCMIMYGLQFLFACIPGTTFIMAETIDLNKICGIPFSFIVGDAIAFSTFLLSAQYNIQNLYLGFKASKDKFHAALCFIPYF